MSQNIIERGAGCSSTFRILAGCPMSTKMKRPHITTAAMATNSPRIVSRPNAR